MVDDQEILLPLSFQMGKVLGRRSVTNNAMLFKGF